MAQDTTPTSRTLPRFLPDFGLFAVIVLSCFAAIPLLQNPGLPDGSDVLYHAFRTAELERSWTHGMLFPRWADGLYYGYGSPLWHFYAPTSYYITAGLMRLFGLSALEALRWLLMGSFIGMSSGMYLFMKQRAGKLAGVIAAIVYLYSPYLIYTEPYARGTYPELLAFALFPFILWRFELLIHDLRGRNVLLAGLSLALLILTHNLMALTLTALLAGWILWHMIASMTVNLDDALDRYLPVWGTLIAGVALSAFFWLPILLESDSVNLQDLIGVQLLDYRNFFVQPGDLVAFMPQPDTGAINGLENVYRFGVAQWGFALLGLVTVLFFVGQAIRAGKRDDPLLRQGIFFALAAALLIFLMTPAATPIWDNFTLLAYLQFPWRLLGVVALCFAVLAGMNALWIERLQRPWQIVCVALFVAAPIVLAAPAFVVPEWIHTEVDTSLSAYHDAEVQGLQRGTTFTNEYLPHDVHTLPGATDHLLADYVDGYPVDKAHAPETVTIRSIDSNPQYSEWSVRSDARFTMEVFTFYWEGWVAEVNGQAVPITPSPEHGFITFEVPEGVHTLKVYLGTTAPRFAGQLLSVLALIALLALGALTKTEKAYREFTWLDSLQRDGIFLGGVLSVAFVFIGIRGQLVWRDSTPGTSPAANVVTYTFDEDIQIIGYDVNMRTLSPGQTLEVVLYWYGVRESDIDFSTFVHVSQPGLPPLAQADKLHPGGRAISEWFSPEGYIRDVYEITLPDTLPPDTYELRVGLYTCELMPPGECGNGYRPTVADADGEAIGDSVVLTTIVVEG